MHMEQEYAAAMVETDRLQKKAQDEIDPVLKQKYTEDWYVAVHKENEIADQYIKLNEL